jgi:hypothetical protein
MNFSDQIKEDSERFLKSVEGAEKMRMVGSFEFRDIVSENDLEDKVKVEEIQLNQTRWGPINIEVRYIELKGEHIYSCAEIQ